jgi:hypothetical protein
MPLPGPCEIRLSSGGENQMKIGNGRISAWSIVLLMLTGCSSWQEVATRLGQHYVGHNVNAVVVQFGPPASTFKMNSGETSYVWQLGKTVETASTEYCKVTVIASPAGIVTQFNTEDPNVGTTAGMKGNFCAERLSE